MGEGIERVRVAVLVCVALALTASRSRATPPTQPGYVQFGRNSGWIFVFCLSNCVQQACHFGCSFDPAARLFADPLCMPSPLRRRPPVAEGVLRSVDPHWRGLG